MPPFQVSTKKIHQLDVFVKAVRKRDIYLEKLDQKAA